MTQTKTKTTKTKTTRKKAPVFSDSAGLKRRYDDLVDACDKHRRARDKEKRAQLAREELRKLDLTVHESSAEHYLRNALDNLEKLCGELTGKANRVESDMDSKRKRLEEALNAMDSLVDWKKLTAMVGVDDDESFFC